MKIYLASPANQLQADAARDQDVLISFALWRPWMIPYLPSFSGLLLDSGAYSQLTGYKSVDVERYVEWAQQQRGVAAWAGLDDISGDYRRSMKNYEHGGFPTIHETDPLELIEDLVPLARDHGGWMGVGLLPPRESKEHIVRGMLDRIPDDLHVHGWALRRYLHLPRIDSVDSTNWWRDAQKLQNHPLLNHLTGGETLEIMVKRYARQARQVTDQRRARQPAPPEETLPLWQN